VNLDEEAIQGRTNGRDALNAVRASVAIVAKGVQVKYRVSAPAVDEFRQASAISQKTHSHVVIFRLPRKIRLV